MPVFVSLQVLFEQNTHYLAKVGYMVVIKHGLLHVHNTSTFNLFPYKTRVSLWAWLNTLDIKDNNFVWILCNFSELEAAFPFVSIYLILLIITNLY